ncbi:hypothetical protein [Caballeronia sp. INDeC2]|uniref:hypothetical protein n=1 Tax=Caballeronia sp. INDeC2 TaxID=2921747 RepID=UPI0020286FE9|nr:hypothetical protein [Caballeronia sp. INDeC2]
MAEAALLGDVAVTPRGALPAVAFKLDGPVIVRADREVAEIIDKDGIVRAVFHLKQIGE